MKNNVAASAITTAYRLDFRPPKVILRKGLTGSNNVWINSVFNENTIFASKSLRGISRFFLEALMNKHVDGSGREGALYDSRHLYPVQQKCYVYRLNISSLEFIDVAKDLRDVIFRPETSRIYNYNKALIRENYAYETRPGEVKDIHFGIAIKLGLYNRNLIPHTEEIIIRGPIQASRISLYQTL